MTRLATRKQFASMRIPGCYTATSGYVVVNVTNAVSKRLSCAVLDRQNISLRLWLYLSTVKTHTALGDQRRSWRPVLTLHRGWRRISGQAGRSLDFARPQVANRITGSNASFSSCLAVCHGKIDLPRRAVGDKHAASCAQIPGAQDRERPAHTVDWLRDRVCARLFRSVTDDAQVLERL